MMSYALWVIDDETLIREGISLALKGDYQILSFRDAESALETMKTEVPDLILLDIGLPGMDGIAALEEIRKNHPEVLVIIITAYEDVRTAIKAMKLGAHDYIIKPIIMPGLRNTIRNALDTIRLKKEVQQLQERYLTENLPCFIRESRSIQNVSEFITRVAQSPDTPILITGETGTGKELIANAIHYRSPNFKGPFIAVNCAAIPRELIESELFGYEKGAFSGARADGKTGMIEAAENGTLFLDEVGDLSPEAQAKLLRFLETGEYYRLGSTRKFTIKTRVISATNKDLDEMMTAGTFRKDLFFRLGVIKVRIPSLNERKSDILPIARHFLMEFNHKFSRSFNGFSPEAEKALVSHEWTGNVRELKNCIERGSLVGADACLTPEDLGIEEEAACQSGIETLVQFHPLPPEGMDMPALQESLERYYIQQAITAADGNEAQAARLLNLKVHTLRYRRSRLKI